MDKHEKTRYSDTELQEFKDLIIEKLRSSKEELAAVRPRSDW